MCRAPTQPFQYHTLLELPLEGGRVFYTTGSSGFSTATMYAYFNPVLPV